MSASKRKGLGEERRAMTAVSSEEPSVAGGVAGETARAAGSNQKDAEDSENRALGKRLRDDLHAPALPPSTPSQGKPKPNPNPTTHVSTAAGTANRFGNVDVEWALASLSAADPKLAEVIAQAGVLPRIASCQEARAAHHESHRAFRSLARAIVFQQLNGAAAATIFNRVKVLVGAEADDAAFTPAAVTNAEASALRACGLSQRKLSYLQGLSAAFSDSGVLSDTALERMSAREVYDALIALYGLGPWSIHMFQMFYLNEPDVLPFSDFGVRKGVMRLYGLTAMPGKAKVEEIAAAWAPYRTLATFYMWHVADGNPKP
uniref:HhH-GPD domain-containing protein n=1 Tax=Mantoniella antarctica TaxID=81844 RepID=A0A7S0SI75_9CHLO|mmetsp:Transcript_24267/g.60274  ORF Transcript_24267/g.60274 Transcript_24267/m.60274 type:complete len:318 (+) Transcript_24267:761-1714(+)